MLIVSSFFLEIFLYKSSLVWRNRHTMAIALTILTGIYLGATLASISTYGWLLIALFIFRFINLARLYKSRMHDVYLRRVSSRTGLLLSASILLLILLDRLDLNLSLDHFYAFLPVVQALTAAVLLLITAKNIWKTRHRSATKYYSDAELPTVTVAIPARNETAELTSCLTNIIANNYPKLEILVLDDCSQDRTADVIKAFARDGVRFVRGHEPEKRWLAKNQAYAKLAQEASGEYILFCGVDVRMGPDAIRALVSSALTRDKHMICVMPYRTGSKVNTALIQPLRYWWELALPRKLFNRPPVLSTCWLINRQSLFKLGGFAAISHSIIPEGFFARELIKNNHYSFIRADDELDIRTVKNAQEQLSTALLMRYPQLRRRPENVLLLVLLEVTLLFGPYILLFSILIFGVGASTVMVAVACALLSFNHFLIVNASNPGNSLIAIVNLPFAIVTEVAITLISMYQYEFGVIRWKGRNICIPVMHVIPRLPPI